MQTDLLETRTMYNVKEAGNSEKSLKVSYLSTGKKAKYKKSYTVAKIFVLPPDV